ncbi:MAG: hypothetical protein K9N47_20700 [Prosthecobacter sp.]|uniref:hypothetical protein n=1 Tax=Prosthecobacter sp. TaxID=1965333 RepID=UPI00260EEBF8|nr:hypothetical protein [Prosthecobacter sp.]MCF7788554.1 hypothetical protein [Prosthecobacter sp.]
MKTQHTLLRKVPHAALAAIMSLSLALKPAYAVDPAPPVLLTTDSTFDGGADGTILNGGSGNGIFVESGNLTLSNYTLQNFSVKGGDGSGGGGGFGGALFINTGSTVTLTNVNFLSNNARGGNGGVGEVGGSLNNLFGTASALASGASGYTPAQTTFTDIEGTTGTKGYNGTNVTNPNLISYGGAGGNGGDGGGGGSHNEAGIIDVTTATLSLVDLLSEDAAANASPFTLNLGVALLGKVINGILGEANAIAALASWDKSLADGQIGLGGSGGTGGTGGNGGFGVGGAAGGNGGNGGAGGANWSASLFQGGAAGGDAGSGGGGGMGGFGAGGGQGGDGGTGGAGASLGAILVSTPADPGTPATTVFTPYKPEILAHAAGFDPNGIPSSDPKYAVAEDYSPEVPQTLVYTPAIPPTPEILAREASVRPSGLDGTAGAGGLGGFGGGAGASGNDNFTLLAGGSGGNGYGGGIFVRAGATLIIQGNALFEGNGVRGGDGQLASSTTTAGASGIGAGSNLFMMKGSTVILDPGAGNVITFNSDPYGTGIADDSAASIIPSGGVAPVKSGSGADIHIASGLVQFNGGNTYSGQTILDGGTLQAQDGDGIYWDSNINFHGTLTSNAVLMSNGLFNRYVGAQSNRVQWTGSGGFAAVDGDLTVNLSNGQTVAWNNNGFVTTGSALVFGALQATDNVYFQNNIDLKGGDRTVLSTTSTAATGTNADGTPTGSTVYMSGKFIDTTGGGALDINDANHDGTVVLQGASTYTGTTNINAGDVQLTGSLASTTVNVASGATLDSTNGGLAATAAVTNNGTLNLGATNDTIGSLTNTGTVNGTGTLTATTYNLNDGSILNAQLGTGTIITSGAVTLNSTVGASLITVAIGSTLNLGAVDIISHTAALAVNGVLNLTGGAETFQTLTGTGTVHTNGYALNVSDGSTFLGNLDAPGTNLTTGSSGSGGALNLGGGTTTTQSTEIGNGLVVGSGATLNSTTITIANGSTLDLSGGGTINFTTLTTKDGVGGVINIGSNDFIVPVGSTIAGNITFVGTGNVIILGTIAPGFSPGVTDLTGAGANPVLGGAYKAELAGTGGVGGTDFDQVQLAPGATLTIGSALNVAGFGGFTAAQGNTFQIISGPGGAVPINHLIGTFSSVTFDADGLLGLNPAVTNAAVVFDVNTGMLTATGLNGDTSTFADLGGNDNQRAAAASIFNAAFVGQNQIDSSTTAGFLALQITDATAGSAADLAKYTPDYYGSLADYAFMGNQVLVRSVQDRVSPMNYIPSQIDEDSLSQVPETMSVFMGYTYANLNTADSARATRNDYYAGVNLLASEDYVFGIAGSMSQGSIHAALGSASSDGWGAMMFGRYTVAKSFTFFGSFGLNQQSMDLRRQTVNGTVTGSTDVASYVGFLGVQYKGWRVGGVSIAPRLSFSYSNSQVRGFSETGAIDALNVGGYHNNRFMGEAGLSALWSTELAGHAFNLEVAASVQQYFQNTKSQMAVNVASVPSASYGVNFAKAGNTQAVIQVNAGFSITKSITSYVGYEGHFGNQSTQYAKAGIRINF